MKSVTYYVANDGAQFDDAEECYQYEVDLVAKEINARGMVRMYDKNSSVLDIAKIESYDDCYYIWVGDDAACDEVRRIWDATGCEYDKPNFQHKTGLWMYEYGNWISVRELIDEYTELIATMAGNTN